MRLIISLFIFLTLSSYGQNVHPYSQTRALTEPLLFGEGVISTPDDDFGGTFSPDGKTVFYSKSALGSYFYVICFSEFKNDAWSTPQVASFSGKYRDFDPVFSPDGKKILFASDRPKGNEVKQDYDIWMVEQTTNGWSDPIALPAPINSEYDEHFASIASSGTIYFSSTRPGALGGDYDSDVYRSAFQNGQYQPAEHFGEEINSASFELESVIAPDERYLLIGSLGRPGGAGSWDIYASHKTDKGWTASKPVAAIVNSTERDYSPRISADGKYIFFTSERSTLTGKTFHFTSYDQLSQNLRGVLNGAGNIYQLDATIFLNER